MSTMSMAHDVWPPGEEHLRPVVTTCYLISVAVLSALLSRRWLGWHQLKRLPIAKLMVLAVLGDSLLFVFASAVLVLGVGTSFSAVACKIGIWWCIILYASSKVLIYSFLSEKLYAVYSVTPTRRIPRWQSTQYKIAIGFLILWLGVAVVMIVGRIAEIRQHDDACVIGLKLYATVPMLTVDAIVNVYLTVAFVLPVYRSRWHKAQTLALYSSIAAVASLVTSFGNILILSIQHGHQLSWVCLGSCGLDVSINAIILYIVTSPSSSSQSSIDDYAIGHHNNKANASHARSTGAGFGGGGGGGGGGGPPMTTTTTTHKSLPVSTDSFASSSFSGIALSSPQQPTPHPPPALLGPHRDSDVEKWRPPTTTTFASDYSLDQLPQKEEEEEELRDDNFANLDDDDRDKHSPSSPPSPRVGADRLVAPSRTSRKLSLRGGWSTPLRRNRSFDNDDRDQVQAASRGGGLVPSPPPPLPSAVLQGVHVSEEVVRVEETGLSPDEVKEEQEWFRRGRQSRGGSGSGFGSGSAGVDVVLPTVAYTS